MTRLRARTVQQLKDAGLLDGNVHQSFIRPRTAEELQTPGAVVFIMNDQMNDASGGQGGFDFTHETQLGIDAWTRVSGDGSTGDAGDSEQLAVAMDAIVRDVLAATLENPSWYAGTGVGDDTDGIGSVSRIVVTFDTPDVSDLKLGTVRILMSVAYATTFEPPAEDALTHVQGRGQHFGLDIPPIEGVDSEFEIQLPQE